MTLPANSQQAAVPWGVDAVVVCWGSEGGPYHVADTVNPLPVNVVAGGGSGSNAAAGVTGSGVPADADYVGLNVGGTLRGQTGVNPTGAVYAGQVDIASVGGSAVTALPTNADTAIGGTTAPAKGLLVVGKSADGTPQYQPLPLSSGGAAVKVDATATTQSVSQSGAWKVEAWDGTTVAGVDAVSLGLKVTPLPTSNQTGPTLKRVKAASGTNSTSVKGSAGQLYGYSLFNNTASARYVKLYNKASAPSIGSDTPAFTIIVPANGGANVEWKMGIPFGTGIGFGITGGVGDSDTTSVSADDVHGFLLYQ
jgi:hypothetical protein